MRPRFFFAAVSILLLPLTLRAQQEDTLICQKLFSYAFEHRLVGKKAGDIVTVIGKNLIGSPYAESTLETGPAEMLVTDLHTFDCVTFVENVLALSLCVMKDQLSFNDYRTTLERVRYRGGLRNGYPSRLHYFSEWITDNEQKGFVRDVTRRLHGRPQKKIVDYLSTHPGAHPCLGIDSVRERISAQEKKLSARTMYVVPVRDLPRVSSGIRDGDIIAITTSLKGLDVRHTGFALRESDGSLHLLHASELDRRVEITPETLGQYLAKHTRDSGVMIVRVDGKPEE